MLPALVLLAACEPRCPQALPWEQVPWSLDQPDDPGHLAAADRAMAAWEQFAEWSAHERVCVTGVVVGERSVGGDQVGGSYVLPSQELQVSPTVVDPWQSTFHELCHAVDIGQGLTVTAPELFPDPGGLLGADGSYDEALLQSESFARLCEIGARDVQRWRLTNDSCGVDFGWHPLSEQPLTDTDLDALTYIQDEVFPEAPRFPWHAPAFGAEVGPYWNHQPPGEWRVRDLQSSADHLVVLLSHPDPWRVGAAARLLWLDPRTGAEQHRTDLPPIPGCGMDGHCPFALVPGSPQPAVRGQRGLWSLTPGTATATERCADADLVVGDTAWTSDGLPVGGLPRSCPLDPSAPPPLLDPPPAPVFALEQQEVWPDPGHPPGAGLTWVGTSPALHWAEAGLQWRDDGGRWQERALPWHLAVDELLPLHDGRHVALLLRSYDRDLSRLSWLTLLDLDTGDLLAPTDPCPLPLDPPRAYAGRDWLLAIDHHFTTGIHAWPIDLQLPADRREFRAPAAARSGAGSQGTAGSGSTTASPG